MGYHFTAAPAKRSCSSFLTLDKGYLLTAASHDLERKAAPLGPPTPVQPSFLGKTSGLREEMASSGEPAAETGTKSGFVNFFLFNTCKRYM